MTTEKQPCLIVIEFLHFGNFLLFEGENLIQITSNTNF